MKKVERVFCPLAVVKPETVMTFTGGTYWLEMPVCDLEWIPVWYVSGSDAEGASFDGWAAICEHGVHRKGIPEWVPDSTLIKVLNGEAVQLACIPVGVSEEEL